MLYDIYKNFDPEYMAVSFDKNKQTFRSEVYKEYKATRKPAPPELVPQFALIREALRTLGVAVYEVDGYEGDDILGTLAARYEKELPVFIVTGDRDALQLATKDTTVYITQRGVSQMAAMTPEAVVEKYGITPRQVIDMKALMGDTSDNIPGVPGVGEKTAAKLLSQYQTLDNLYGHVGEIKGAVGKKLAANKELAYLSYRLATIKTDVPFEATLEGMKQPVHFEEMMEFFHRLGLERIADRYSTLPRFRELAVSKKKEIQAAAVKLEEFPLHPDFTGKEVSLVLHMEGKAPFYHADLAVVGYGNHVYRALPERFEDVCMALAAAKHVIVQDSKSIYESDFPTEGIPFYDMTLVSYVLEPTRTTYPLSYMAELFGTSPVFPDHLDTEEEKSACICGFLLSLYATSLEHMKSNGVQSLFEKIENPLAAVLAEMEKAGIATDQKRWEAVCHELKVRERKLLSLIYEAAGEEFNVNSPKQLGVILFEKMGMPAGKKTKNGYSTAADVLEMLAKSYPFVKDILEYRTISKLISTYLEALPLLIRPETGRIHTSFNQTVTATGRLSSSDPNLQNIPVRTAEGRQIRSLFVPGPGYDCFISSDYSQVELRVLAHMSGDEQLIEAYKMDEDIHRITASKVFHTPFEEVTDLQRRNAKAVNFGIVYGISSFGLSQDLSISTKEAKGYIDEYFKTYPGIKVFLDKLVSDAKEKGYCESMFGRRRPVPELKSSNFMTRSFGERVAMNSPIQGTAADIIKIAMLHVYDALKAAGLQSKLILQIHDELLIETRENETEEVRRILSEEMKNACHLAVELEIDLHTGSDWYEAK